MQDTIAERAEAIVEEFSLFDDWMGKYEHLIELGRSLPLIEDEYKTDEYRIRGCQSQVWLRAERDNGHIVFKADSDALITRGLIALLVRVLNGQPPEAIARADLSFLDRIGMKEHLSPTRKNGLDAMIRQMKLYAVALGDENVSPDLSQEER
ncbi:MAG: Fe-S metabolism protein SufE [Rhodothermaceae bacterium]|nr:MAG: Fe-S metabolism protein SufE [Rhodothermaceae bacterium]